MKLTFIAGLAGILSVNSQEVPVLTTPILVQDQFGNQAVGLANTYQGRVVDVANAIQQTNNVQPQLPQWVKDKVDQLTQPQKQTKLEQQPEGIKKEWKDRRSVSRSRHGSKSLRGRSCQRQERRPSVSKGRKSVQRCGSKGCEEKQRFSKKASYGRHREGSQMNRSRSQRSRRHYSRHSCKSRKSCERRGPSFERRGPSFERRGPSFERRGPSFERRRSCQRYSPERFDRPQSFKCNRHSRKSMRSQSYRGPRPSWKGQRSSQWRNNQPRVVANVKQITWSPQRGVETRQRQIISSRRPRDFIPQQKVQSFSRSYGNNDWVFKRQNQDPWKQYRNNLRNQIQRDVNEKIQQAFRQALIL